MRTGFIETYGLGTPVGSNWMVVMHAPTDLDFKRQSPPVPTVRTLSQTPDIAGGRMQERRDARDRA